MRREPKPEPKPILQQPEPEPAELPAEPRPRRSSRPPKKEAPEGYRSTKRSGKGRQVAKREERAEQVADAWDATKRKARNIGWVVAWGIALFLVAVCVLLLLASAINGIARWNARRIAGQSGSPSALAEKQKQNTLYIAVQNDKATGFLATRVDPKAGQAFGIAIPAGALVEIPGQGFERLGEAYPAGPKVMMSAVSNFIGVPFVQYAVIPAASYSHAVQKQTMSGLIDSASRTNLPPDERVALSQVLGKITSANTAIAGLPVKPIPLGGQTYLQPERDQIAELIKQWWGVQATRDASATRVIVFNGAGLPGIAGVAAQQLIRAGLQVVDTKNADRFTYPKTLIVVQRGPISAGSKIAKILGVGQVVNKPADQNIAEVLVIIGKDYKAPANGP